MNAETKCYFLVAEPGKWAIKEHLKPLNAIYNGVGWFIEEKFYEELLSISQQAKMRLLEWPLNGQTFETLKRNHKRIFFEEKLIKLKFSIDEIKNILRLSNFQDHELTEINKRSELEKIPEGRKLLNHFEEYDRLQVQLKRIDEEEKVAGITPNKLIDIKAYTLEDLQKELSLTKEGLKTGYAHLDEMIRVPNEAITLIGGRPSHGKTTFMLNLFINMVFQYPDHHFYFFSYEETRAQIAVKIINILSGFVFEEAKNLIQIEGYLRLGTTSLGMVENGKKKYQELVQSGRLRIIGEAYPVQELSTIISYLKSTVPVGAIYIDYIQKIKNKQRFGTRQLELANTSNMILETAKKYSVPIILGAQLGRDRESRDKVKLDNLREAGDLEQDANLVLGIFNPSMEKAQEEQKPLTDRKVELKVTPLKNRNGLVNKTISLEFDRPLLKIRDKEDKKNCDSYY
jgi:replicative DNA helicase